MKRFFPIINPTIYSNLSPEDCFGFDIWKICENKGAHFYLFVISIIDLNLEEKYFMIIEIPQFMSWN